MNDWTDKQGFEKYARKKKLDLRPMTPYCIHITYFDDNTQKEWIDWINHKLDISNHKTPTYVDIDGNRIFGETKSLETRLGF